jgi:hypothetical protein
MQFKRASGKTISIDSVIHTVRREKIILDADLARIYGVATKRLNEQVKRNVRRFPSDFAFRLSKVEFAAPRWTNRDIRPVGQPVANYDRFPKTPRSTFSALCIHRARRAHGC